MARNLAFVLALLVPAGAMATALIAQFGYGLAPCEMCWWQRYAHIAAIVLALGASLTRGIARRAALSDLLLVLAGMAVLASGLIGGYHAGVEYHWWEGITTCSSSKITGDPLEAILNAPVIRCDVPAWTWHGISMAGFNFLGSTLAGLGMLALWWRGRVVI